jgi:hypothetical protein
MELCIFDFGMAFTSFILLGIYILLHFLCSFFVTCYSIQKFMSQIFSFRVMSGFLWFIFLCWWLFLCLSTTAFLLVAVVCDFGHILSLELKITAFGLVVYIVVFCGLCATDDEHSSILWSVICRYSACTQHLSDSFYSLRVYFQQCFCNYYLILYDKYMSFFLLKCNSW